MIKILATEKLGVHKIAFWMEDKINYYNKIITDDDTITDESVVAKSGYRNYEHFALTMGKFDPYTIFMLKPIGIKQLDFESILDVANDFEKLQLKLEKEEKRKNENA